MEVDSVCFWDTYPDKTWNKICRVFTHNVVLFQYESLESSLKDSSFGKESTEAQSLEVKANSIIIKVGGRFLLNNTNTQTLKSNASSQNYFRGNVKELLWTLKKRLNIGNRTLVSSIINFKYLSSCR